MLLTRIRELRQDNNLTQSKMAEYLHIKQGTYSDYERGIINVPIDMLIKIADYYHVSLDYLVGRE